MQVDLDVQLEVEQYAFGMVLADAQNPDVGFGLLPTFAVDDAIKYFVRKYGDKILAEVDRSIAINSVLLMCQKRQLPGYSR